MQSVVDTLIIIPNQNLFRIANEKTTFADAFAMADQVLYSGVGCITDLMVKEGLINLDFADVRAVMREMGKAMMGTGEASGENRALQPALAARPRRMPRIEELPIPAQNEIRARGERFDSEPVKHLVTGRGVGGRDGEEPEPKPKPLLTEAKRPGMPGTEPRTSEPDSGNSRLLATEGLEMQGAPGLWQKRRMMMDSIFRTFYAGSRSSFAKL
jgi:hypothetical protein